ncbi:MAG: hypothetical protein HOB70_10340 [Chloroflexi bacterium]|jgi:hypothetical protein|nr:hypothetical protein [Chloroflexota bacterium]
MKKILTIVLILATVAGWTQTNLTTDMQYVSYSQYDILGKMSKTPLDVSLDGSIIISGHTYGPFSHGGNLYRTRKTQELAPEMESV